MSDPKPTNFTPAEELMLEALAGRWRCGEKTWTFNSQTKATARRLEERGYVTWQSGIVPKTILVSLTDKGRAAMLSDDYAPPQSAYNDGWNDAKERLADERAHVAFTVKTGETDMRFLDGVSHAWSILFTEGPKRPPV